MIELIKLNFKDLLSTFVTKPWVGLVLFFMFLTGYFINKWTSANTDCNKRIYELQHQKDSLVAISFDRLLTLQKLQTDMELERRKYDSILRSKLELENKILKDNEAFR